MFLDVLGKYVSVLVSGAVPYLSVSTHRRAYIPTPSVCRTAAIVLDAYETEKARHSKVTWRTGFWMVSFQWNKIPSMALCYITWANFLSFTIHLNLILHIFSQVCYVIHTYSYLCHIYSKLYAQPSWHSSMLLSSQWSGTLRQEDCQTKARRGNAIQSCLKKRKNKIPLDFLSQSEVLSSVLNMKMNRDCSIFVYLLFQW